MKVSDVMTRNALTVKPETPLKVVARILVEQHISGVPVVAGDRVVGVVTDRDILYKERGFEAWERDSFLTRVFRRRRAPVDEAKLEARKAGEAMTSPVIAIRAHASVAEAARLMLDHGVNRLPVLEDGKYHGDLEGGRLVGIVTHADLVRAFVRSDREIVAEIEEILEQEWIPRGMVTFEVREGVVTIGGEVEWQIDAEALLAAIRRVTGVVTIDSRLTWRDKMPAL